MSAWRPHPQQAKFLQRGEFEVLYGGAAGGGKSDALIASALVDIEHPKYHGLILRRTFPQLQEIIDRSFQYYPQVGGVYKSTLHRWEWSNGAKITLGHMQHENDKENYQGKEFHFVGFDELTHFTESQYLYLMSRVRRSSEGLGLVFRATTNPGSIGHVWVKERFIDISDPYVPYIDPISKQSRVFIPATVYDNPSIMDNDPGYVLRLEALPAVEKKRLLYGEWEIFEGQVFAELTQRIHMCEPFQIPNEWEKFISFDWGFSKPFSVGWYALDYDDTLYRYREWYGCNEELNNKDIGLRMSNIDIARGILEREHERIKYRVADPACWSKNPLKGGIKGPSVIEDMQKEGMFFLKADNNRILGKNQVHERFKVESEIDEETGEIKREYPKCVIFSDNKHFWRTIPLLRQDERNIEDVDTDQEDHIYDEFRYACMSKPIVPKLPKHGPPVGSFAHERNKYIRAKKYAQRHGVSMSAAYSRIR